MDIHLLFQQTFNKSSIFNSLLPPHFQKYLVVAIPGIFGGSVLQISLVLGFPSASLRFSFLGSAKSVTTCPMLSRFQKFLLLCVLLFSLSL